MNINLDRFNPEINWKGRHLKIGLVSFVASLYGLSQTPAAMLLLGIAAPTAAAIPAAVNAVVSVAAPIIGALVYNPKDTTTPAGVVAPQAALPAVSVGPCTTASTTTATVGTTASTEITAS